MDQETLDAMKPFMDLTLSHFKLYDEIIKQQQKQIEKLQKQIRALQDQHV